MIVMRSLMATMMQQLATFMSAGNSRFDTSGLQWDVYAWIMACGVAAVAGRRRYKLNVPAWELPIQRKAPHGIIANENAFHEP
jgi:hypothetical protein